MFIKSYKITERNNPGLTGITNIKEVNLINTTDIYKIGKDVIDFKGEPYRMVYCRHKAANPGTFAFMAFLAILLVGVPWFIAYALGCKIATASYLCKVEDLVKGGLF